MIRSPSGAVWRVVDETDGTVTLELARLPDGTPAELRNTQRYSRAEIDAGAGWQEVAA